MFKKALVLYILIAYTISFMYIWIFSMFYRSIPNELVSFVLGLVMFAPTIASFITIKTIYKKDFNYFLDYVAFKFNTKSIILGFSICFIMGIIYTLMMFIFSDLGFFVIKPYKVLKTFGYPLPIALILLSIGIVSGMSITTLFTIGEEIGWRGFLYRDLSKYVNNFYLLSIIIGMIWAFWHFPILYFLHGEYHSLPLPLNCLMFLGFCVLLTLILLELRIVSGSIVPCAIVHAFINTYFVILYAMTTDGIFGALGIPAFITFICTYIVIKILLNKMKFLRLDDTTK